MTPRGGTELLLAHGASGTAASMAPWVTELALHRVTAEAIDLPRGRTDRALDVFRRLHDSTPAAAVGGHSFGGRVAGLLAAESTSVRALVLLSYPLHRPGKPGELRTDHWPAITCPVLLLSGDRDPFARPDLLEREVKRLRRAELQIFPGQRHGLLPVRQEAAGRIAAFLASLR
jgi:predicted alpha/beta-hydrolase family hydrolase